jgi:hypothetical protein
VKRFWLGILLALGLCLVGCSGGSAISFDSDAGKVVEQYMQAKIDGNRDALRDLLCNAQEANLDREAQSFSGVKAHLENVKCQKDANANTVTCSGAIVADYNGENTNFPLTKYNVVQVDGLWKWCGEAG